MQDQVNKWTPGPWSIEPAWDERCGGGVAIVNRDHPRDDWDVCEVHSTEANARLIAAAPDLLEALEAAIECGMVPTSTAKEGGATAHARQVHVADQIRAAIAKARGAQ